MKRTQRKPKLNPDMFIAAQEEEKDTRGPSTITKKMRDYKTERILLLGRSGTGKTYAATKYVLQLIKDGKIEGSHIVLMSKTWRSDPSQKELVDYCEAHYTGWKQHNAFEEIDIKFLEELFNHQKRVKEFNPTKLHNWMCILDDQISDKIMSSKNPTLINLFCVGRHFAIGMVTMLQRFRGVMNCTMRDQYTRLILLKQGNKKALLDLLADYEESPMNAKQGLQFIYECYTDAIAQDGGHGNLCINTLVTYGEGRLEKGLGSGLYYDGSEAISQSITSQEEEPVKKKRRTRKQKKEESSSSSDDEIASQ